MGYDFMIDSDFRVWLLEVNASPSIGSEFYEYKKILVPKMLEELVQIVVDPLFPPSKGYTE